VKQLFINSGKVVVKDIPSPMVEKGSIIVAVDYSCISPGTELSGVRSSGEPLWRKALKEPQKVKNAISMVKTQGISKTSALIKGKLYGGSPTGYSAAGIIIEVGKNVKEFKIGDRVACAGAQCAHHAEVIRVPLNLAVSVPSAVEMAHASTVTLGSIALQGVRRLNPTLGETFVIIGLGLLGQLTAQMLQANGCRTIGVDLDLERLELSKELGLDLGINPAQENSFDKVARLTENIGADGVIITAASPSDDIVSTAFQLCRRKGRVVLVGDVGLNLNRSDFYQKEIDFFISTSYGPGRYDANYEEHGLDYPIGYVRWTENRNMAEYLRLLAQKKINIQPLISTTHLIDAATEAYESLSVEKNKPLMILLSYPRREEAMSQRVIINPKSLPSTSGKIRIAVVGAGGFAKGMHLPNLQSLSNMYEIHCIMSRTGHNAENTANQFGASYSTTDYNEVLSDPKTDSVLICTRHHLHADMTIRALEAGKHVLVEKPLAMNQPELEKIEKFYTDNSNESKPILLTGYNRRFSPYALRIKEIIKDRKNPLIINYRMNAGYLPLDHWVHTEEGGGRNIGEACHIYDLFTFLTDSKYKDISVKSINSDGNYYSSCDNFITIINFEDGSLATLTYTAMGAKQYPKEHMEIYSEGRVITMTDYKTLNIHGSNDKGLDTKLMEKGQFQELEYFGRALNNNNGWPIPLWQQIQSTVISLSVQKIL